MKATKITTALSIIICMLLMVQQSPAKDWTWYIYSSNVVSGSPGYCDVTVGIKANSAGDVGELGNHNLLGTMSADLYDFGSGHNPEIPSSPPGVHVSNFTITLTNPTGSNNWRLNGSLDAINNGPTVTTGGIQVVTIRFYINNSSGTSQINLGTLQETYEEDNTTQATASYDNSGGDVSLPVQMSNIEGESTVEGIVLRWETASEVGSLGFHVWRSDAEDGEYERITAGLIPGQGNSSSGAVYNFTDRNFQASATYYYRIEQVDADGGSEMFSAIEVTALFIPTEYALSHNYPNPFNPVTTFTYDVPEASEVTIRVYSLLGKEVKTIYSRQQVPGRYTQTWDGTDNTGRKLASGSYFLVLTAGELIKTRKILLLR